MFISFEGIDGSGKTTQARLLAEALRSRGHTVVEVREPGGTHLGEQVRSLLLDSSAAIDPRAELLLFSAARAQLVVEVIQPALDRGAIVIADRFFDSSTAYQGAGRDLDEAWMPRLHQHSSMSFPAFLKTLGLSAMNWPSLGTPDGFLTRVPMMAMLVLPCFVRKATRSFS